MSPDDELALLRRLVKEICWCSLQDNIVSGADYVYVTDLTPEQMRYVATVIYGEPE